jgi:hypothetical protein
LKLLLQAIATAATSPFVSSLAAFCFRTQRRGKTNEFVFACEGLRFSLRRPSWGGAKAFVPFGL